MARTLARLKISALDDPDFTQLTIEAEWLYWVLLQQRQLSLAGHVDLLLLERWSDVASNATSEVVLAALVELERYGYVIVDWATREVLIRTFTRHDLEPSRVSSPMVKGLWSAWSSIRSATLRAHVVTGIPDALWIKAEKHAPPAAVETRRSPPPEREGPSPLEREPPPPPESPASCLLPPASCLLPSASSSSVTPERVANEPDDDDLDQDPLTDTELDALCHAVAEARAARRGPPNYGAGYVLTIKRTLDRVEVLRLHDLGHSPSEIEQKLDGYSPMGPSGSRMTPGPATPYADMERERQAYDAEQGPPLDPDEAAAKSREIRDQLRHGTEPPLDPGDENQ